MLQLAIFALLFALCAAGSADCPPGTPVCPDYCGGFGNTPIPPSTDPSWTLVQAQIIIRHGARAPISFDGTCFAGSDPAAFNCTGLDEMLATSLSSTTPTANVARLFRTVFLGGNYSKSEDSEMLRGTCPNGQLLLKGYEQERLNGLMLGNTYVGANKLFATSTLPTPQEMIVRSTDNMRCFASGRAVLNGMFPPPTPATNEQQIVNFFTTDGSNDMLTGENCALMADLLSNNTVFYMALDECIEEQTAINNTIAATNLIVEGGPSSVWDCVMAYGCQGLELPASVPPAVVSTMMAQASTLVSCQYNVPRIKVMSAGALLQDMLRHFKNMMSGGPLKFVLYSAHDITIMAVQACLNVLPIGPTSWPPYASLMSFELYQNNAQPSKFGVRIIYNGNITIVPGCSTDICDFDTVASIFEANKIPDGMCDVPNSPSPSPGLHGEARDIAIGLGIAFGVTTLWAIAATVLLVKTRKRLQSSYNEPLMNFST